MTAPFTHDVATDSTAHRATLRLADGEGGHLAAHWSTSAYTLAPSGPPPSTPGVTSAARRRSRLPERQLADLGAFLGEHVLGPGTYEVHAATTNASGRSDWFGPVAVIAK